MSDALPIRVVVLDTWDEIVLSVAPSTSVAELKARALSAARIGRPPDAYLVKYRGAELWENGRTVEQAGIGPNAQVIVLSRRRIPAK